MRTSLKTLSAACGAALLLACGTPAVVPHAPEPAPPADDSLTALEQACLDQPLNAEHWAQLGAALQALGQTQRAAAMLKQARMLREHDVQRDLAILPPDTVTGLDRTEIVPIGAALVLVRRIPAAQAARADTEPSPQPLRLEISNGNGVTGLAANWARKLQGKNIRIVRLSNIKPFAVNASRIEYRPPLQAAARALSGRVKVAELTPCEHCTPADVRIVLGRDVRSSGAP